MIPQSHISRLSNRLLAELGGRRIPEYSLERDYCIAWFLVGLSRTPVRNKLIFKGGTALRRCYFSEYRFSEDLDFTLAEPMTFAALQRQLEPVYYEVKRISNIDFRFSRPDPTSHQNSYTFYLSYEGPLPATSTKKEIKVDVTINECVFYPPAELAVLKSCEEFSDVPEDEKILVYQLTEIASEKTIALHDRARTEPRDLYDLWYLTEECSRVDLSECMDAITAKLSFRGKSLDAICDEFQKKEVRLKKTWETRLANQMSTLCEFDDVYRSVKRSFRRAGLTSTSLIVT